MKALIEIVECNNVYVSIQQREYSGTLADIAVELRNDLNAVAPKSSTGLVGTRLHWIEYGYHSHHRETDEQFLRGFRAAMKMLVNEGENT